MRLPDELWARVLQCVADGRLHKASCLISHHFYALSNQTCSRVDAALISHEEAESLACWLDYHGPQLTHLELSAEYNVDHYASYYVPDSEPRRPPIRDRYGSYYSRHSPIPHPLPMGSRPALHTPSTPHSFTKDSLDCIFAVLQRAPGLQLQRLVINTQLSAAATDSVAALCQNNTNLHHLALVGGPMPAPLGVVNPRHDWLQVLAAATHLSSMSLRSSWITGAALSQCLDLTCLTLNTTAFSQVPDFKALKRLKKLQLGNVIFPLDAASADLGVSSLGSTLTCLEVSGPVIPPQPILGAVSALTRLQQLEIRNASVVAEQLTPQLSTLAGLSKVVLSQNKLVRYSGAALAAADERVLQLCTSLSAATALRHLELDGCDLASGVGLALLKHLTHLSAAGNRFDDLAFLSFLPQLRHLNLHRDEDWDHPGYTTPALMAAWKGIGHLSMLTSLDITSENRGDQYKCGNEEGWFVYTFNARSKGEGLLVQTTVLYRQHGAGAAAAECSAADVASWASFTALQHLDLLVDPLRGNHEADASFCSSLAVMSRLTHLQLTCSNDTGGVGFVGLAAFGPGLQKLDLTGCRTLTAAALKRIAKMPCMSALTCLVVAGCNLSSGEDSKEGGRYHGGSYRNSHLPTAGLAYMVGLQRLEMSDCRVKDASDLAALCTLTYLAAGGNNSFNASSIAALGCLTKLQHLVVAFAGVRASKVQQPYQNGLSVLDSDAMKEAMQRLGKLVCLTHLELSEDYDVDACGRYDHLNFQYTFSLTGASGHTPQVVLVKTKFPCTSTLQSARRHGQLSGTQRGCTVSWLAFLQPLKQLQHLVLPIVVPQEHSSKLAPMLAKVLGSHVNLNMVTLVSSRFLDAAGLAGVAAFAGRAAQLDLTHQPEVCSPSSLWQLSYLCGLTQLVLNHNRLSHNSRSRAGITRCDGSSKARANPLQFLARMTQLRDLEMNDCGIVRAGALSALQQLVRLGAAGNRLDAEAVSAVGRLTQLEHLDLQYGLSASITTAAACAAWANLVNLTFLRFSTGISTRLGCGNLAYAGASQHGPLWLGPRGYLPEFVSHFESRGGEGGSVQLHVCHRTPAHRYARQRQQRQQRQQPQQPLQQLCCCDGDGSSADLSCLARLSRLQQLLLPVGSVCPTHGVPLLAAALEQISPTLKCLRLTSRYHHPDVGALGAAAFIIDSKEGRLDSPHKPHSPMSSGSDVVHGPDLDISGPIEMVGQSSFWGAAGLSRVTALTCLTWSGASPTSAYGNQHTTGRGHSTGRSSGRPAARRIVSSTRRYYDGSDDSDGGKSVRVFDTSSGSDDGGASQGIPGWNDDDSDGMDAGCASEASTVNCEYECDYGCGICERQSHGGSMKMFDSRHTQDCVAPFQGCDGVSSSSGGIGASKGSSSGSAGRMPLSFLAGMQSLQQLLRLQISSCCWASSSAQLSALQRCTSLTYLRASDDSFTDGQLAVVLASLQRLQHLDLADAVCCTSPAAAAAMVSSLQQLCSLTYLDLSRYNLARAATTAVAASERMLSFPNLHVLRLNGCCIDDCLLPQLLGSSTGLRVLSLSSNPLTLAGVAAVAPKCPQLTQLQMGWLTAHSSTRQTLCERIEPAVPAPDVHYLSSDGQASWRTRLPLNRRPYRARSCSTSRSPPHRCRSRSRSPLSSRSRSESPARRSRSRSESPARRSRSRSESPARRSMSYSRSRSESPARRSRSRSESPARRSRSRSESPARRSMSYSRSRSESPARRSRSRSESPARRSRSRSESPARRSRSRSESPARRSMSYSRSRSESPARRSRSRSKSPARHSRSRSESPARRSMSYSRSRSESPARRSRSRSESPARRSMSCTPDKHRAGPHDVWRYDYHDYDRAGYEQDEDRAGYGSTQHVVDSRGRWQGFSQQDPADVQEVHVLTAEELAAAHGQQEADEAALSNAMDEPTGEAAAGVAALQRAAAATWHQLVELDLTGNGLGDSMASEESVLLMVRGLAYLKRLIVAKNGLYASAEQQLQQLAASKRISVLVKPQVEAVLAAADACMLSGAVDDCVLSGQEDCGDPCHNLGRQFRGRGGEVQVPLCVVHKRQSCLTGGAWCEVPVAMHSDDCGYEDSSSDDSYY